jgi:hypothetical protein
MRQLAEQPVQGMHNDDPHQHGHVAADAVIMPGDLPQIPEHGFLQGRVAIAEL